MTQMTGVYYPILCKRRFGSLDYAKLFHNAALAANQR